MKSQRVILLSSELDIDPALIQYKVTPDEDLWGIVGGDWDIVRRYALADAAKHRAIREHFLEGRAWLDTDLFKINYAERLREGPVKNRTTLRELAVLYDDRIRKLYRSMEQKGFDRLERTLPRVAIGRDGDVFLTSQGNHRLAIAQILKLPFICCFVQCCHALSR